MSQIPVSFPPIIATYPALGEEDLLTWAAACARILQAGDTVCLWGDLGAGKSTVARAMLRALGITDHIPSPTYTLMQHYQSGGTAIAHIDLYRLRGAAEAAELGLVELWPQHLVLLEWPERLDGKWPTAALHLQLQFTDNPKTRKLTVCGHAPWPQRLYPQG
jgi:tRNA threonylcarbamoyladenosine biosynthesis protein TsaE